MQLNPYLLFNGQCEEAFKYYERVLGGKIHTMLPHEGAPGASQAGFSVSIQLKDAKEGERIFNALAEGGKVKMPFAETFWAARFGMLTDKFGIPWMINCERAA